MQRRHNGRSQSHLPRENFAPPPHLGIFFCGHPCFWRLEPYNEPFRDKFDPVNRPTIVFRVREVSVVLVVVMVVRYCTKMLGSNLDALRLCARSFVDVLAGQRFDAPRDNAFLNP